LYFLFCEGMLQRHGGRDEVGGVSNTTEMKYYFF